MTLRCLFLMIFITFTIVPGYTQSYQSTNTSLPLTYFNEVSSKAVKLKDKLSKKSQRALQRLKKSERKLKARLAKTDSIKAAVIFSDSEQQYRQLEQKLLTSTDQFFIPSLDTITTSLNFLDQNQGLLPAGEDAKRKLTQALGNVKGLGNQFKKADEIRKFLKERKQYLKEQLGQFGSKYTRQLKQLNKQVYYYSEQLQEYKELLKDHKKVEKKVMEMLSKAKPFRDFMRKNSQLASLFRLPADPDDPSQPAVSGLQTRVQVNQLIDQQLGAGGPGARQQFQQNIQDAQSRLNDLKTKILKSSSVGNSGETAEGFKPNNQKTKSFLQRLEFGTNIQSQKSQGFFPVTSDIGLSLGYKLNDQSIVGIGASYKLGLGKDIRHIRVTHQGVGLRSFADWKLKGSFWVSGGYEMNYRNEINNIDALKDFSAWQQSGLIGLSKVISLKTKFFKKTRLQLLWDFLSYQQLPRTQPILFRIGYNF